MLFVVVFSSSLFFFFFDESNFERVRSAFAPLGEVDDDATKMISFVSFPGVVLVEAADAAQEAGKRSTSGSAATINEGTRFNREFPPAPPRGEETFARKEDDDERTTRGPPKKSGFFFVFVFVFFVVVGEERG